MKFYLKLLKILLSVLLLSSTVQANVYDESKLQIFSKLIPRFVLMSSQKKVIDKKIKICILHNLSDKNYAELLLKDILKNNPNGIGDYKLNVISTDYSDARQCSKNQLVFLFNENLDVMKKSIDFFNEEKTITVSYDQKYLKNGIDISLFIGHKVLPYINLNSLHQKEIYLDSLLVKISKIYKEHENE
jgi:hypothetical protein